MKDFSWGVRYQYEEYDERGDIINFSIEEETIFTNYKEAVEYFQEKVAEDGIARVCVVVYRGTSEHIFCVFTNEWDDTFEVKQG